MLVLSVVLPAISQNSPQPSPVAEWLESYRLSGDFSPIDMFSIAFKETTDGADLVMAWDTTQTSLPITFKK